MTKNKFYRVAGPLLVAAILAGCGGGGGGGGGFSFYPFPPAGGGQPPTTPPPQADAYDTFIAYVKALVTGGGLDTAEAADVAMFDPPPTSETKDPVSTE
ncbi:hypothetical protein J2W32_002957 [Variovorax boronicumulans]|jgi:hypothetical protein|uniref:Lipoprotein n=1 Tax=Variovorax boronicumulans TaxID=436515 RepID=A0AAW8CUZ9_9BURK|nr:MULTISPECIES: hypothetical protein [Variovorax]MDP9894082.1 hypothetical protein [Variovorax boronicumulans]MDQ0053901.1 hypothetical protein [Variovorax boronicumulans]MDQ0606685.1 hypothetical protein [Variovorax sp. W1I1]